MAHRIYFMRLFPPVSPLADYNPLILVSSKLLSPFFEKAQVPTRFSILV